VRAANFRTFVVSCSQKFWRFCVWKYRVMQKPVDTRGNMLIECSCRSDYISWPRCSNVASCGQNRKKKLLSLKRWQTIIRGKYRICGLSVVKYRVFSHFCAILYKNPSEWVSPIQLHPSFWCLGKKCWRHCPTIHRIRSCCFLPISSHAGRDDSL